MSEKELGNSCCINVFCARAINYPLCKAMVYHDHEESKPWELGNPMMRTTDMEENGRGLSIAKGESLETVECVFTLAA